MRPCKSVLLLLVLLNANGCGYRLAARRGDMGQGITMAIPTFVNRTKVYRIEQRVSEALRREVVRSTRYEVTPENSGDLIVSGEVLDYGSTPVVLNPQGRSTQYSIEFGFRILVTDARSGEVLLRNDRLPIREIFQLAETPGDFVPEDSAAWNRVAEKLASSVVSSLVHRAP